jgi:beta-mannosidase
MYADCWGEVGWTIMDAYLRRKTSWYFVRRAFSPVRLILRQQEDDVIVTMANDTQDKVTGTLEYGRVTLDGSDEQLREKRFSCPPLERKVIATFKRGADDPATSLWIARVQGEPTIWPGVLRATDMRNLKMVSPKLTVKVARGGKGMWRVRVSSNVFAHAVHLALPDGAAPQDDYFDLLPRETREVLVNYVGTLSAQDVTATSVVLQ